MQLESEEEDSAKFLIFGGESKSDSCFIIDCKISNIKSINSTGVLENMYEYDSFASNSPFPLPSSILTDEYFEEIYSTKTFW
jgi:hypothetical protein